MPQLKVIQNITSTTGQIGSLTNTPALSMDGAQTYSAQCNVTVDTESAETFLAGVAALLVVQDLTYTAAARGTAGNSITIAYTGGGTAGAEVVTVVGSAISVQIQSGTSTGNQIRTAVNLSAAATALIVCSVSGTGSNAQTTASATPLATGVNSAVNTTSGNLTITAHGLVTGDVGQLSVNTGSLPTGFSTSTNYYVIFVDVNTIRLASTLANAIAGTPIIPSSQGTSGSTITFTPTTLASASVQLQKSNDNLNWTNDGSAVSISATGIYWVENTPKSIYQRLQFAMSAGQMTVSYIQVTKGLN